MMRDELEFLIDLDDLLNSENIHFLDILREAQNAVADRLQECERQLYKEQRRIMDSEDVEATKVLEDTGCKSVTGTGGSSSEGKETKGI